MPVRLPVPRWALAPPFHPCLPRTAGGLFSVALSLGLPRPGVTRHRAFRSPDFPRTGGSPLPPAVIQPSARGRPRRSRPRARSTGQSRASASAAARSAVGRGPGAPRAEAQPERGEHGPRRRPAPRSRRPRGAPRGRPPAARPRARPTAPPARGGASRSGARDRPCGPAPCRNGRSPARAGWRAARGCRPSSSSSAAICGVREGMRAAVLQLDPDRAGVDVGDARPSAPPRRARRAGPRAPAPRPRPASSIS